jgi:putative spermidine/putrescine transport system permease protein
VPETTTVAAAPESLEGGSGVRGFRLPSLARAPKPVRAAARYAALLPFVAYVGYFLAFPLVKIIIGAFQSPTTGAWTTANVDTAVHGVYLEGFRQSITLSLIAAVIPGIIGMLIAYAIFTAKRASFLRQIVITASGVFANFGGVPLAFVFIASVGSSALVTTWLNDIGINLYNLGFSISNLTGMELVYSYFQIPLMVLIILPALEGLRPAWREAAENLGARSWQFWRYVGGPVLLPSFLSCLIILFGSAFAAYATAEALTSGSIPLTSIQIGNLVSGNVIANGTNLGEALAFGMVIIIAILMVFYLLMQRRASKWLR